jgi:hypothetical protein
MSPARRVLKVGGRLFLVGHGRAAEPGVARWQDRIDPFWQRLSGGCHLNRKIDDLLAECGLSDRSVGNGLCPRTMTFFYEGAAKLR